MEMVSIEVRKKLKCFRLKKKMEQRTLTMTISVGPWKEEEMKKEWKRPERESKQENVSWRTGNMLRGKCMLYFLEVTFFKDELKTIIYRFYLLYYLCFILSDIR